MDSTAAVRARSTVRWREGKREGEGEGRPSTRCLGRHVCVCVCECVCGCLGVWVCVCVGGETAGKAWDREDPAMGRKAELAVVGWQMVGIALGGDGHRHGSRLADAPDSRREKGEWIASTPAPDRDKEGADK